MLKKLKGKLFASRGFTLAEVAMAAGLVGLVGLGVMHIVNQQMRVQKRALADYEINSLSTSLSTVLRDPDACKQTLAQWGNLKASVATVTSILKKDGNPAFTKGTYYGDRSILLADINITNFIVRPDPVPAGKNGFGELVLNVVFEKHGKMLKPTSSTPQTDLRLIETRSVPLKVTVDSAFQVVSCYSVTEDAALEALKTSCSSIGGTYNESTSRCVLKSYAPGHTSSKSDAVSVQFFEDYTSSYPDDFVNVTGDSMTGLLAINADLLTPKAIARDTVCVAGRCRNFAEFKCSDYAAAVNKIATGIDALGRVSCRDLGCLGARYFAGFKADGSPECRPLPTKTCGTNEYVSSIASDGSVTCSALPPNVALMCPNGQFLRVISSSGSITCDPVPVDTNTNIYGKQCSSSLGIVTSVDSAGNLHCIDYCPACGACGTTRAVGISCSPYGTPINGTDECRITGWTRIANPYCYCPCGGCGSTRSVWGSCSYGSLVYGTDQCRTSGWVRIANPWCSCSGCSCGSTRTVWVGTTPRTQVCDTAGWRYL